MADLISEITDKVKIIQHQDDETGSYRARKRVDQGSNETDLVYNLNNSSQNVDNQLWIINFLGKVFEEIFHLSILSGYDSTFYGYDSIEAAIGQGIFIDDLLNLCRHMLFQCHVFHNIFDINHNKLQTEHFYFDSIMKRIRIGGFGHATKPTNRENCAQDLKDLASVLREIYLKYFNPNQVRGVHERVVVSEQVRRVIDDGIEMLNTFQPTNQQQNVYLAFGDFNSHPDINDQTNNEDLRNLGLDA